MAKPVPGGNYTVSGNEGLRAISRKAYGYDRSADIVDANADLLKGRGISLEGLPIVYVGDVISIPDVARELSTRIAAGSDDEIAIRLDGREFKGWTASNISRNINTIADGFTFSFPYNPNDLDMRKRTRPYSYKNADLFIGGDLYISGQCIKWSPSARSRETMKTIDVRTKAGHIIECMAQKTALEFNNQKLSQIATAIMQPYGDNLKPIFLSGDSDRFTKVRKEITDTDFGFLQGLAAQKGFMITSSDDGSMAFLRADIDGRPVFRFVEGESGIVHMSVSYDGQKRFSSYTAVTQSAGSSGPSNTLIDSSIPIYRPFAFSADDLEAGNLDTALQWRRSKALASSAPLTVTVAGWRNRNNDLWLENMKGSVIAPSLDIFTETDYIISGVNLNKSENDGNIAKLDLVLLQAYSLEFPDSFPWEG